MEDPAQMQPRPEAPSRVTALPAASPAVLGKTYWYQPTPNDSLSLLGVIPGAPVGLLNPL